MNCVPPRCQSLSHCSVRCSVACALLGQLCVAQKLLACSFTFFDYRKLSVPQLAGELQALGVLEEVLEGSNVKVACARVQAVCHTRAHEIQYTYQSMLWCMRIRVYALISESERACAATRVHKRMAHAVGIVQLD
jgi:hypothetical protein